MTLHYECIECQALSKQIDSPNDYIRLHKGNVWVCNSCKRSLKGLEVVQILLNGQVVYKPQF